ncbi:tyrosine-type recombinase/integrase [Desulfovibrio oxyclinae]|uniref:tyrosine-type recombinase/integrase n=1 Tax=Desulfovibrio oxyclinae TaxID=63560 RepID=UPI0003A2A133|nr:site-specific integrase [Desulfovibrio oxyclinae]
MSSRKRIKTKYPGVYYRDSSAKTFKGKPDRCFSVWYKDATGKPRWQTVGWASEGVRAITAKNFRDDLLAAVRRGKGNVSIDLTGATSITVGDAFRAYERWARGEGRDVNRERNRYDKHLSRVFDAMPLTSVSVSILEDHKHKLLATLSPQTVHHCFSLLRRAVNRAMALGLHSGSNPFQTGRASAFKLPTVKNDRYRFFTPEEARDLLGLLRERSRQTHDMSLLSLRTGLRSTEIFTILGRGVRPEEGIIRFTDKQGNPAHVHAPVDVLEMLAGYERRAGEHVFQSRRGGPIRHGISAVFQRCVDELGLNDDADARSPERVTFHTWRHTFASWLAQSGEVTLQELKEMLRHERIEMTLRYAHLIPGHQSDRLSIIEKALHQSAR